MDRPHQINASIGSGQSQASTSMSAPTTLGGCRFPSSVLRPSSLWLLRLLLCRPQGPWEPTSTSDLSRSIPLSANYYLTERARFRQRGSEDWEEGGLPPDARYHPESRCISHISVESRCGCPGSLRGTVLAYQPLAKSSNQLLRMCRIIEPAINFNYSHRWRP